MNSEVVEPGRSELDDRLLDEPRHWRVFIYRGMLTSLAIGLPMFVWDRIDIGVITNDTLFAIALFFPAAMAAAIEERFSTRLHSIQSSIGAAIICLCTVLVGCIVADFFSRLIGGRLGIVMMRTDDPYTPTWPEAWGFAIHSLTNLLRDPSSKLVATYSAVAFPMVVCCWCRTRKMSLKLTAPTTLVVGFGLCALAIFQVGLLGNRAGKSALGFAFIVVIAFPLASWIADRIDARAMALKRFRLKTLLMTVAVFGVILALISSRVSHDRVRLNAIAATAEFGGRADVEPAGPYWLWKVFGKNCFLRIEFIGLHNPNITDSDIIYLKNLTELETLHLNETSITDDALVHLTRLKNLRTLSLFNTNVTEEGAEQLRQSLPECTISN